jgi:hypothetical protein
LPEQLTASRFFNSAPILHFSGGTQCEENARVNLVELMVALLILTLGLLGIAATADSAGRAMARAGRMGQAVARARVTVDSLRGRACGVAGSASGSGPGQRWTMHTGSDSIRYLSDSVRVEGDGPPRRFTLEGVAVCH